jgi:hypothetical protein
MAVPPDVRTTHLLRNDVVKLLFYRDELSRFFIDSNFELTNCCNDFGQWRRNSGDPRSTFAR